MAIALRIAGQRDHVLVAEDAGVLDDIAADIREQHAVALAVETVIAAGVLHRLEGHAAHAVVVERVADDLADLRHR